MTRLLKLQIVAPAAIAVALAACAGGMKASTPMASGAKLGDKPVDPAMVQAGVEVWRNKGCYGCHGIGRQFGAPDLAGVTERRDLDWLRKWLKETDVMLQTDPQAQAMMKDWHGAHMPNMKLNDRQVEALLHYMANETAKVRGGGA